MRTKKLFLTITSVCFMVCLVAFIGCGQKATTTTSEKPVISDAERALAMWQVQNVMSKHAYYHAAGKHLEELADIWVDENGPNAATATFASPAWIMKGVAGVKKYYGQGNQDNKVKELEALSKLYPEIENKPENLGAGHEYAMHTNTTPVIEVAGDGKTAKGIWYSPGIGLSARLNGTNVSYGGTFFWEKYGADFIKENGVWKMWHCQMFYDWTPSFPASMTDSIGRGMGGAPAGGQGGAPARGAPAGGQGAPAGAPAGAPGGAPAGGGARGDQAGAGAIEAGESMSGGQSADMVDNTVNNYENYSIKRVPTIEPRFPEPYYTFSETFTY
jgi:hypothetical protein